MTGRTLCSFLVLCIGLAGTAACFAADAEEHLTIVENFSSYDPGFEGDGRLTGQPAGPDEFAGKWLGAVTSKIAEGDLAGPEPWKPLIYPQTGPARHLVAAAERPQHGPQVWVNLKKTVTKPLYFSFVMHTTGDGPLGDAIQFNPDAVEGHRCDVKISATTLVRGGIAIELGCMYTGFGAGTVIDYQPGVYGEQDFFIVGKITDAGAGDGAIIHVWVNPTDSANLLNPATADVMSGGLIRDKIRDVGIISVGFTSSESSRSLFDNLRMSTDPDQVIVPGRITPPERSTVAAEDDDGLIKDERLEAAIKNQLRLGAEHELTKEDLAKLTGLTARKKEISDLSGLEHAVNLQRLDLSDNSIRNLAPLGKLTNLEWLRLENNLLSDIASFERIPEEPVLAPLANLQNLKYLNLEENRTRYLEPLSNLKQLEVLNVNYNEVIHLEALSDLTNLEQLHVRSTPGLHRIEDLSPISGLKNLRVLDIFRSMVSDFDDLSNLGELEYIQAGKSKIVNIDGLAGLTKLKTLQAERSLVSDLSALATLENLENLVIGTPSNDLRAFSGMKNLMRLSLTGREITDVTPLGTVTSLQDLGISWARVSDLSPLAGLVNLQRFDFNYNSATPDISAVANFKNVRYLSLFRSNVKDISPLASLETVHRLSLGGNQITDISPIKDIKGLQVLDLNNNRINISPGSPAMEIIKSIENQGARVYYKQQQN